MIKDISQRIKSFNEGRSPFYLGLKYKAMNEDKFRFFRATAHLFFEDIPGNSFLFEGPSVWLCGDMHIENFGSYKGENRIAYFNINDFDECLLGSTLLDMVRMLTCIYIASPSWGINLQETNELTSLFVDSYFDQLHRGYIRDLERETAQGVVKNFLDEVATRERKKFLDKRTVCKKDKRQLVIDNKHCIALAEPEKAMLINAINSLAQSTPDPGFYKVLDVAHRIAGTSSLGLNRYVALVEGHGSPNENYLLSIKETQKSCLEKYVKTIQPKWKTQAGRIVEVQKRVLSEPPALLNSIDINKKNYLLKELQPTENKIDYHLFNGKLKKLRSVMEDMARVYAWGNFRSSGRQGSAIADDLISFAEQGKKIKKELLNYAFSYSKTMDTYHQDYCSDFEKGFFED